MAQLPPEPMLQRVRETPDGEPLTADAMERPIRNAGVVTNGIGMATMQTLADVETRCGGDANHSDRRLDHSTQRSGADVDLNALAGARPLITLLLVDDQPQVLRGLEMRLALEPDVVVVGEAADAETALHLAEQLRPDVVVMDVELPRMDGITATQLLKQRWPDRAVIMLSLHDDCGTQLRARQAGASAFVAKHQMEGPLLAAIREAARHAQRR